MKALFLYFMIVLFSSTISNAALYSKGFLTLEKALLITQKQHIESELFSDYLSLELEMLNQERSESKEKIRRIIHELKTTHHRQKKAERLLHTTHTYFNYLAGVERRRIWENYEMTALEDLIKRVGSNIKGENRIVLSKVAAELSARKFNIKEAEIKELESMQQLFNAMGLVIKPIESAALSRERFNHFNVNKIDGRRLDKRIKEYKRKAASIRSDIIALRKKIKASEILMEANMINKDHPPIRQPNCFFRQMNPYETKLKNKIKTEINIKLSRIHNRIEFLAREIKRIISKVNRINHDLKTYKKAAKTLHHRWKKSLIIYQKNPNKKPLNIQILAELLSTQNHIITQKIEKCNRILDLNKAIAELRFQTGEVIGEASYNGAPPNSWLAIP